MVASAVDNRTAIPMSASRTAEHADAPGFSGDLVAGPEQRAQDRYLTRRTAIDIDRQRNRVYDISTGGVRMKAPPDCRLLGDEIQGMLVCKAGGADIRVRVRGRVVRVEADGETVGVQFTGMPASHREAIDAVITMMERLEIEAAFEKAREPKKSSPILRAAVATAVFSASFSFAALYLWIR